MRDMGRRLSLRKAIFDVFKLSLNQELPTKGDWGYSMENAIIIDKNDVVVKLKTFFDGVGCLEYIIVEKRIYLEQIALRKKGNRTYDHLIFTGYSLPIDDYGRVYRK